MIDYCYGIYACGHKGSLVLNVESTHEIVPFLKEKEFKKICLNCYAAKRKSEKNIENKNSLEKNNSMNLIDLKGSPKQIEWAITIRIRMIEDFNKIISDYKEFIGTDEEKKKEVFKKLYIFRDIDNSKITIDNFILVYKYILENFTSAKMYIDNRALSSIGLFYKYYSKCI